MLKRFGVTPPAAILPDKYRTGGNANDTFDRPLATVGALSTDETGAQAAQEQSGRGQHSEQELARSGSEDSASVSTGDAGVSLVDKLLSSKGQFRFDQLNGSFRYFGPTTNCHIYSEILLSESKNGQSMEHDDQVDQLLHSIAPETQQYLMELYFQYETSKLIAKPSLFPHILTSAGITMLFCMLFTKPPLTKIRHLEGRASIPNIFTFPFSPWVFASVIATVRT